MYVYVIKNKNSHIEQISIYESLSAIFRVAKWGIPTKITNSAKNKHLYKCITKPKSYSVCMFACVYVIKCLQIILRKWAAAIVA